LLQAAARKSMVEKVIKERVMVVVFFYLFRRQDLSAYFSESDADTIFFRESAHDHRIAILDEFAF
jgi:hypothetical protein